MAYPSSVLITGANRGIGLALVRQICESWKDTIVFATYRNINDAKELKELSVQHPKITPIKMDVTNEVDIIESVKKVSEIVGPKGLNVLINNSGILKKGDEIAKSDLNVGIPQSIVEQTKEFFDQTFAVNSTAPFIVSKHFLPLILKASKVNSNEEMGCKRATIVNVSSSMGSIAENASGGYYSYRMSKAALNMLTKSLSVDLLNQKVLAVSVHPGWVQTRMGGSNASITARESAMLLFKVIANLSSKDNGKCVRFDNGSAIPY